MDIDTKELQEYVDRMKKVRLLSTPDLDQITDAEEYSKVLLHNFSLIGMMAAENRKVIDQLIKPILPTDHALSEDVRAKLDEFADLLFDDQTFGEVDVNLSDLITNRLMEEELHITDQEDINEYVISISKKVQRDYLIISRLTRFQTERVDAYRQNAIQNRDEVGRFLEKEQFRSLREEARSALLRFSLMAALLFESTETARPTAFWDAPLAYLEEASRILQDSFYRELMPDYDWEAYEFRIYYYGSFLAYSILPEGVAKKAHDYAQKAIDFLNTRGREDILANVNIEQEQDLLLLASVQAGYLPAREACDRLFSAYEQRDENDFSVVGLNLNLDTPSSFLRIAKQAALEVTDEDIKRYNTIQRSVIDYVRRVPKSSDTYLKCVTLVTNFPTYFRELPGAMTLEEFCLKLFAAIHPPTFIHINMVADLTESLVRHLFDIKPQQFIGFPGCDTPEKVLQSKERISDFAYHAALCHDLGKLFIMDVITMYGRGLLDDEFELIKMHPVIGARIASEHASTREYADIIRGHHLWYDCSRGYPADADTFASPYKTIIDLVLAADCLDAATDTVGRSYNKGKTFEDFKKEIEEGSGTHYAPFLPELLNDPGVKRDIEYLLSERRMKLYTDTFLLLKNNRIESIKASRNTT